MQQQELERQLVQLLQQEQLLQLQQEQERLVRLVAIGCLRRTNGAEGIKKGTKVFVDGELEISSFTDDDGQKRMTFRVVAGTYRILNGRRSTADEEPEAATEGPERV